MVFTMGRRKKAKPNPPTEPADGSAVTESSTSTSDMPPKSSSSLAASIWRSKAVPMPTASNPPSSTTTSTPDNALSTSQPNATANTTPISSKRGLKEPQKSRSWYGSWPRKSTPSTQVARETIMGGTLRSKKRADFSRFDTERSTDSVSLDGAASSSSLPNMLPSENLDDRGSTGGEVPKPGPAVDDNVAKTDQVAVSTTGSNEAEDRPSPDTQQQQQQQQPTSDTNGIHQPADSQSTTTEPQSGETASSSWLGWLGQSAYYYYPVLTASVPVLPKLSEPRPNGGEPEVPEPPKLTEESSNNMPSDGDPPKAPDAQEPTLQTAPQEKPTYSYGSYLFGFWPGSGTTETKQTDSALSTGEPQEGATSPPSKDSEDVEMEDAPAVEAAKPAPAQQPKSGSTWAFWYRDSGSNSHTKDGQKEETGQLAVVGESSESQPKNANVTEPETEPSKEPSLKSVKKDDQPRAATPSLKESSSNKGKRARPQSMVDEPISRPNTPKVEPIAKAEGTPKAGTSKSSSSLKLPPPNLVLPSFKNVYRMKENPSIVRQIKNYLLWTQQPAPKHVNIAREPPKIKKAIAFGVHGLIPTYYLRPITGQPTGTSIKFANHGAEAIRRWAESHGCGDCEIDKVALEGEGKIDERVENLWKLLLNWIDKIRQADVVIMACHSQGVPVSIMLLAKLYELGVISPTAKVGVCAMAGVSLGPFPDYKTGLGILMGSAAELWEFGDPQSEVSRKLEAAVKAVLHYGARITYIGSIDDQLVPLESAIYAPAHHPYIYRAVFIDGRIHAPDFIAHLVGFALKLRNLGVTDHGLIRELSVPLAGSLYTGDGHSRLYDDEQVYDLAISHALETTDVSPSPTRPNSKSSVPCDMATRQPGTLSNPNPYHLPWIMRGLLEEDFVKSELSNEVEDLLKQFDDWKPTTKALKDVKYRLEAVRSKL
ncbi:hypothetical protein GE21DRAFT_4262 [Neurospora crassa]|uniref:YMC020W-like alpha/beta hydrolase domain-containing protein n=1 Tax=Neurospora crassa (strain ATCC 24698 / 74-OR23-1A / CBS 708.71 / DSM 1257 / FGSC 987) TaxID=367110 RepID=Q7SB70_NEUCR|nr:hypothetical protein NCU06271 [Neurospora crassa OR74A]EAA33639.2 hypothetical protein NCU06271 [Neurospora crassa OR74A]KHE84298.1 hypothetical protein GE21DRAFT_4262 [Neurospora crassa]|eukprot:XP_962875.2 hypothetical protein NCU06271 [Neurospora crassa OR74A]